jgi:hypothetical protein
MRFFQPNPGISRLNSEGVENRFQRAPSKPPCRGRPGMVRNGGPAIGRRTIGETRCSRGRAVGLLRQESMARTGPRPADGNWARRPPAGTVRTIGPTGCDAQSQARAATDVFAGRAQPYECFIRRAAKPEVRSLGATTAAPGRATHCGRRGWSSVVRGSNGAARQTIRADEGGNGRLVSRIAAK